MIDEAPRRRSSRTMPPTRPLASRWPRGAVEIVTGQASPAALRQSPGVEHPDLALQPPDVPRPDRDSRIDWLFVAVGGKAHRAEIDAVLAGQGSETELVGADLRRRRRSSSITDPPGPHRQRHPQRTRTSRPRWRDAASSNFQGLIRGQQDLAAAPTRIWKTATCCLSDHSKAESDPRPGDPEQRRRPLRATARRSGRSIRRRSSTSRAAASRRDEAERLVVEAFFEEVLRKIPVEAIRDQRLADRSAQARAARSARDDGPRGADAWQHG